MKAVKLSYSTLLYETKINKLCLSCHVSLSEQALEIFCKHDGPGFKVSHVHLHFVSFCSFSGFWNKISYSYDHMVSRHKF